MRMILHYHIQIKFSVVSQPNPHEDRYKCPRCDASFASRGRRGALTRHFAEVHLKVKKFMCNYCEKTFSRKENLSRHVEMIHCKKGKDTGTNQS